MGPMARKGRVVMIRRVIQIDGEKCNGCGACAAACHEGAIAMVEGKAKLMRDDYCDGLGDCLPVCPTGAITFVNREAAAYDEKAVRESKAIQENRQAKAQGGCLGQRARSLCPAEAGGAEDAGTGSQLRQWPCQIKLAPVKAPYFQGAKLLIAADCAAYACAQMHGRFMGGKITLIGCPKLDGVDYSEKLAQIIRDNDIQSVAGRSHGGTLLRRVGRCGEGGAAKQRQVYPLADLYHFGGRKSFDC